MENEVSYTFYKTTNGAFLDSSNMGLEVYYTEENNNLLVVIMLSNTEGKPNACCDVELLCPKNSLNDLSTYVLSKIDTIKMLQDYVPAIYDWGGYIPDENQLGVLQELLTDELLNLLNECVELNGENVTYNI